jgi:hypothetical protein
MAEYDQFLPSLIPYISNLCPRLIMLNTLKSAIRQFCQDSEVWVYDCPTIEITDEQTTQARLEIPYQSMVCKLWTIGGRTALHDPYMSHIELPRYRLNSDNYLIFEQELKRPPIKINPIVSLATTQDSLTCPDFIFQRYHDAIISKAIVILQSMPAQEWTDPNMLQIHEPLYIQHLDKAKRDREDGFMMGRRTPRIKPKYM